jgi:hypothetical protein
MQQVIQTVMVQLLVVERQVPVEDVTWSAMAKRMR